MQARMFRNVNSLLLKEEKFGCHNRATYFIDKKFSYDYGQNLLPSF